MRQPRERMQAHTARRPESLWLGSWSVSPHILDGRASPRPAPQVSGDDELARAAQRHLIGAETWR